MIIHRGIKQGSVEWHSLRCGRFTGSDISDLMGKTLDTDTAQTYILTKLSELMTGEVETIRENEAMRHGKMYEAVARNRYVEATDILFEEVSFVEVDKFFGVSPDGINETQKIGIEIKCPFVPVNHVKFLFMQNAKDLKSMKKEYYWQCLAGLLATGFDQWHFVTYHPKFKVDDCFVLKIMREEVAEDLVLLETRIKEATALLQKKFNELYGEDLI